MSLVSDTRCDLCGLPRCNCPASRMIKKNDEPISLGRQVGQPLADIDFDLDDLDEPGISARSRVATAQRIIKSRSSTMPVASIGTPQERVIIPPPPKLPTIVGKKNGIDTIGDLVSKKKIWVNCNFCQSKVHFDYLDAHIKVHADQAPRLARSTDIVVRSETPNKTNTTTQTPKKHEPKLEPIESYKFRKLDQFCAASSMSQDGRYSDFTIILWMKEHIGVSTTYYAGGGTTTTFKDWERFSIHIVYDSLEDYYTLTSKLLKRGSYSTWDTEESAPDRICCTPKELQLEIKRALLFFRINPVIAYKGFRKLFKQELKIDYDANNRACIAQTKNCDDLADRLNKKQEYEPHNTHQHWGGC